MAGLAGGAARRAAAVLSRPAPASDTEALSQTNLWEEMAAFVRRRHRSRRPGHVVLRHGYAPAPGWRHVRRSAAVGVDRLHAARDARRLHRPARQPGCPAHRGRRRTDDSAGAGHSNPGSGSRRGGRRRQRRLHRRARHPWTRRGLQRHLDLGLDAGPGVVRRRPGHGGLPGADRRRAAAALDDATAHPGRFCLVQAVVPRDDVPDLLSALTAVLGRAARSTS